MEKEIVCTTSSPGQTKKLGLALAKTILTRPLSGGAFVVAMSGCLGAGKTQLAKGIARALGVKKPVNSPTFPIIKKYPYQQNGQRGFFWHIDCYRLRSAKELAALGIKKLLLQGNDVVVIEWPDIAKKILPTGVLQVDFESVGKRKRRISINFNKLLRGKAPGSHYPLRGYGVLAGK